MPPNTNVCTTFTRQQQQTTKNMFETQKKTATTPKNTAGKFAKTLADCHQTRHFPNNKKTPYTPAAKLQRLTKTLSPDVNLTTIPHQKLSRQRKSTTAFQ
jgi:hypothetical protein